MAYAMTKQGSLDNCVTYEFICDAVEDMNAIEDRYRTIGTVAIVLSGASGLEVYIAGSDKQWNSLSSIGGSAASDTAGLSIYICAQNEVSEGVPDVELPDEQTLYLVPAADPDSGNLYDEYIYVEEEWEKFGSGGSAIDLSAYATKVNPVFSGSISLGRVSGSMIGDNSVAEGNNVVASGVNSHAEGEGQLQESKTINGNTYTTGGAYGIAAHAEGYGTLALNYDAHAEGYETVASGEDSHTEGAYTTASGNDSHAEGYRTVASGGNAHAEGQQTIASGSTSHTEGTETTASGENSHVEGTGNKNSQYIIDNTTYIGTGAHGANSHAEGIQTWAIGNGSHSEGSGTTASGVYSHAEGSGTTVSGYCAHAEGNTTTASGSNSHAEGNNVVAAGDYSHAEGFGELSQPKIINNETYMSGGAYGNASHAEGSVTIASGNWSHAEGSGTTASGNQSHAEGGGTTASQMGAHAEGGGTTASGSNSHAEGGTTTASGSSSHAEGGGTRASSVNAHAEGGGTTASGMNSHAEGNGTIATGSNSHVSGSYNISDSYDNWPEWAANTSYTVGDKVKRTTGSGTSQTIEGYICKTTNSDSNFTTSKWNNQNGKMNYAEIIGNGNNNNHSNARALDWNGNEHLMGDIYVGCSADSTGGTKLPRIPEVPSTNGTYILQATVTNGTPTYSWVSLSSLSGVTF